MTQPQPLIVKRYVEAHNRYHEHDPGTPGFIAAVADMRRLEHEANYMGLMMMLEALHPSDGLVS